MQIEAKSICASKQAQFYSQHLNNIFPRGSTDTDSPSMELFQQHLRVFPHVVFTIGCEEFLEANDGKNGGFLLISSICLQGCHGAQGSRCGVLFETIVIKHISGSITSQMHSHLGSTMFSQQMVAGVR